MLAAPVQELQQPLGRRRRSRQRLRSTGRAALASQSSAVCSDRCPAESRGALWLAAAAGVGAALGAGQQGSCAAASHAPRRPSPAPVRPGACTTPAPKGPCSPPLSPFRHRHPFQPAAHGAAHRRDGRQQHAPRPVRPAVSRPLAAGAGGRRGRCLLAGPREVVWLLHGAGRRSSTQACARRAAPPAAARPHTPSLAGRHACGLQATRHRRQRQPTQRSPTRQPLRLQVARAAAARLRRRRRCRRSEARCPRRAPGVTAWAAGAGASCIASRVRRGGRLFYS